jgi:sugar (pentulose or hexulose) kinase
MDCLTFPTVYWFRKKMPGLFRKTRYFASTIDYLNFRLTGKFAIDYTNCAMTMMFDLNIRDWSDKALGIAGIDRGNVAEIVPSGTVLGTISAKVAEELGLPKDTMVVSGAHDQYCASVGAGAFHTGDCVLSAGTAWVVIVTSDRPVFERTLVIHPCIHVFENRYGLLTTVPSGGNSLNWFHETFCPASNFEGLNALAKGAGTGSAGLMFIPRGVSRSGSGSFMNIDTAHTLSHFTRSVFEGVALATRKHLETFSQNGITIQKIIMIGGGAQSTVWPQIVADVSNRPIGIPEQKETAFFGAAVLAGVGSGRLSSFEEACGQSIKNQTLIKPVQSQRDKYDEIYSEFIRILEIV